MISLQASRLRPLLAQPAIAKLGADVVDKAHSSLFIQAVSRISPGFLQDGDLIFVTYRCRNAAFKTQSLQLLGGKPAGLWIRRGKHNQHYPTVRQIEPLPESFPSPEWRLWNFTASMMEAFRMGRS